MQSGDREQFEQLLEETQEVDKVEVDEPSTVEELHDQPVEEESPEEESPEEEEREAADSEAVDDSFTSREVDRKHLKAIYKLRRSSFAKDQKIRELEQQNQNLRSSELQNIGYNIEVSRKNLEEQLRRAKAKVAIALEEKQGLGVADGNAEIAKITGELSQLDSIEDNYRRSSEDYQLNVQSSGGWHAEPEVDPADAMIASWMMDQEVLHPESAHFDREMYVALCQYGAAFDAKLHEEGNSHLRNSYQYLKHFQDVLDDLQRQRGNSYSRTTATAPRLRHSGAVGLPSSGSGSSGVAAGKVRLSALERQIADSAGLTYEEYLREKMGGA